MKSHQLPRSDCPKCGYHLDAATGMQSEKRPEPGDYTICIECASVLVFADDLHIRLPTAQEETDAPLEVVRVQLAVRAAKKEKP